MFKVKIKILKSGINGEGIGYLEKKPVFVEGALPQEEVEIKVIEKNPRFYRAKATRIIKRSSDRIKPACFLEQKCGGCSLMCAKYEAQLQYKQEIVIESLAKYANIEKKRVQQIIKSPSVIGYRNALKLPFVMHKGKLSCALYASGSNHPVQVDSCMVHEENLEKMKKRIVSVLNKHHLSAYDHKTKKGMRTLILRGFANSFQCTLITGENVFEEALVQELMELEGLVSLWQSVNTSKKSVDPFGKSMIHLGGSRLLDFKLDDLSLRVSPKSFFQLNTKQAKQLYSYVSSLIPKGNHLIVEAYSGIGAISLYLKDKAEEIIGIEYISDAVSNANKNAKINGAKNVSFVCGDAGEKMRTISKKKEIDYVVVDPPRSGLDEVMIECLLKARIKNIIYISCNQATLAKNIDILSSRYKIDSIQPFDMFPNTAHVESVTLLKRKTLM